MKSLLLVLLGLASGAGHASSTREVTVELIEFNHFQAPCTSGFDQVIFWRFNPMYARYEVRGWLGYDSVQRVSHNAILYEPRDYHGRSQGRYLIRGLQVRETSTEYDPETADKRLLADQYREPMPWNATRCRQ